jgi:endogenous inhibitor of DNA gyrase (YacG/DUF329 family)
MPEPVLGLESDPINARHASCKICGSPVRGRRKNGFCSDRCRMTDRRSRLSGERQALLARFRTIVRDVEDELMRSVSE